MKTIWDSVTTSSRRSSPLLSLRCAFWRWKIAFLTKTTSTAFAPGFPSSRLCCTWTSQRIACLRTARCCCWQPWRSWGHCRCTSPPMPLSVMKVKEERTDWRRQPLLNWTVWWTEVVCSPGDPNHWCYFGLNLSELLKQTEVAFFKFLSVFRAHISVWQSMHECMHLA